jgi:hypothetical protein
LGSSAGAPSCERRPRWHAGAELQRCVPGDDDVDPRPAAGSVAHGSRQEQRRAMGAWRRVAGVVARVR